MGASTSTNRLTLKLTDEGENLRVKYASATMQGWRPYMEDALAVELDLDATTSFFGVYDGHGGAEVAMYCAKRFHTMLHEDDNFLNNLPNAIEFVCARLDDDLQQSNEWRESLNPRGTGSCLPFLNIGVCANIWRFTEGTYVAPLHEGSTACVVIIRGNQIVVGNVGDSRCVLSKNGQAIALSVDHKPTIPYERERIERAGGQVFRPVVPVRGIYGNIIWQERGPLYVQGMLAMTRAIGDFALKKNRSMLPSQQMVTCVPDIHVETIADDTEFLVIASDGIWDHMSSENVVNFVRQELRSGENLRATCEKLVDRCLQSRDNTTAILVQFKHIEDSDEVASGSAEHQHNPEGSDEQLDRTEHQHNPEGIDEQQ